MIMNKDNTGSLVLQCHMKDHFGSATVLERPPLLTNSFPKTFTEPAQQDDQEFFMIQIDQMAAHDVVAIFAAQDSFNCLDFQYRFFVCRFRGRL